MLGSFKGEQEVKQMKMREWKGERGKKKGDKDEEERGGEEGRQRERERQTDRQTEKDRHREREKAFPFCGLFLIFAVFFVSLAQLCSCNYSQ